MKCASLSPKHANTPAELSDKTWALVTEDQFCRFPSLLCFEEGPLHIDPLWRLFVIPWTITVKPGAALFPTRRSSQRGFRHTISHGYSTITDAAATYRVQINIPFISERCRSHTASPLGEDGAKFGHKLPNKLLFSILWCDVTFFNNSSATSCHACHWNALMIPALLSWQTAK